MIQRRQTLWLLLATITAILSFLFPFVTGKEAIKNMQADKVIDAASDFFLLILTGGSIILSTVTIFLFKDRKMQIRLCLLGLLVSVVIIVRYIMLMNKLTNTTLALYAVLPFIFLASYFLAFRDIRKDEKLVKSLDKLR
jgi:peptidoglycan/LPS O-acetylase OafA/YrhL